MLRYFPNQIYASRELIQLPSGEIVTISEPNKIQIINQYTGVIRANLIGHGASVLRILYLTKSGLLASASYDFTIKLWNVTTGALMKSWTPHNDYPFQLVELPNGNLVSSSCWVDQTIKIWNAKNNFKLLRSISVANVSKVDVQVVLNNGYLVVSTNSPFNLLIINPNDGSIIKTIPNALNSFIYRTIVLPNGDFVTSGYYYDSMVKIYGGNNYSLKKILSNDTSCFDLVTLPNNHIACASLNSNEIIIWNLESGKTVKKFFDNNISDQEASGLVVLKNGELASRSFEGINIWGIRSKIKIFFYFNYFIS